MTATATIAPPEVGTFYAASWGYDETRVDFYRVVGVTAKSVKVQKWSKRVNDNGSPTASAVPGDGPDMVRDYSAATEAPAPVMTRRVKPNGWIAINSYCWASPWDGTPQYQTGYGWGR